MVSINSNIAVCHEKVDKTAVYLIIVKAKEKQRDKNYYSASFIYEIEKVETSFLKNPLEDCVIKNIW